VRRRPHWPPVGSCSATASVATRRRVATFLVAVGILTSIAGPPVAASAQRTGPDTQTQLSAAQTRAEQLRSQLALLRARSDWTNERLGVVRDELASATSRSVSSDQQLAAVQSANLDATATLARRVRAIEQSGGPMALYSQAIDGSSLTDIVSNVAALNAVLGTDAAAAAGTAAATVKATAVHDRLANIADQRAALVRRANALADQANRLLLAQHQLLADAHARIQRLARTLAKEQEAATAAAGAPDVQPGATDAPANPYAATAIAAAESKLGSDYVWGAEGPNTFDCSGLVQWSYGQAGLVLPRLADEQYFAGTPIALSAMQPGDLLVYAYDPTDANTIHHITMYIGNGQMIQAPHTGDVVRIGPVYYDGLYGVARPGL